MKIIFMCLDAIYDYIKNHDYIRLGQFLENFYTWHKIKYREDLYYINNETFLLRLKTFINSSYQKG